MNSQQNSTKKLIDKHKTHKRQIVRNGLLDLMFGKEKERNDLVFTSPNTDTSNIFVFEVDKNGNVLSRSAKMELVEAHRLYERSPKSRYENVIWAFDDYKLGKKLNSAYSDGVVKNPQRKGTKQNLPNGADEFRFLPMTEEHRRVFKPRNTPGTKITLPTYQQGIGFNTKQVTIVKLLGKGHATVAYLADDNWVYLFTKEHIRDSDNDTAKQVLVELIGNLENPDHFTKVPTFAKHIPWIEFVGWTRNEVVHRMPLYFKLPAGSEASKAGRKLQKIAQKACFTKTADAYSHDRDAKRLIGDLLTTDIPLSIRQAVRFLIESTENYGENWFMEFSPRNLAVDEHDNLVLLDVIFDTKSVRR